MWDDLWIGATIATMSPGSPYGAIRDGALAVDGDEIAWVGSTAELGAPPERCAARVHETFGLVITPGLIDAHTHLIYGGTRAQEFEARLGGATYEEIARDGGGIRSTVAATRAATENQLFDAAADRLVEMLKCGVTTVEIKSGYGLDLANEMKQLRVARRLGERFAIDVRATYLAAHVLPTDLPADEYVEFVCREALPAIARAGLADAVDAFCDSIAFSVRQVARIFEAARALGLPVKLHADQLTDQHAAALAAEFGALSADHLERSNAQGISALAASGTIAVLLPGAYYFLRERKKPPVRTLRKHRVPIAVATDCNPGTSPMTSLPLALNMACTLFGLTAEEALAGATRNAARALGLGERKGTLAKGKVADFVVWEVDSPAEIAYYIGVNRARTVVKDGRVAFDVRSLATAR